MRNRIKPVGHIVVQDDAGRWQRYPLVGDEAGGVRIAEIDDVARPIPKREETPGLPDVHRAAERAAVRRLLFEVFGASSVESGN